LEFKPDSIRQGDSAVVKLTPIRPFSVEPFDDWPPLGRLILEDNGQVLALGIITKVEKGFMIEVGERQAQRTKLRPQRVKRPKPETLSESDRIGASGLAEHWTIGNQEGIAHVGVIGSGGYGEVYEVTP
jgi:hypothetical protein